MAFTNEPLSNGSTEPKNKVYVKGVKENQPFFEVNMADGSKSEHKSMLDMTFVKAERHVYKSEEYGDKPQIHIVLQDTDGTQFDFYGNWNNINRAIFNSIASESKIDKISISFQYDGSGNYKNVVVFLNGNSGYAQWAFSGDDYHSRVEKVMFKGKENKDYTKLDEDITVKLESINQPLEAFLEQAEAKATKKEKKEVVEDDTLPF